MDSTLTTANSKLEQVQDKIKMLLLGLDKKTATPNSSPEEINCRKRKIIETFSPDIDDEDFESLFRFHFDREPQPQGRRKL